VKCRVFLAGTLSVLLMACTATTPIPAPTSVPPTTTPRPKPTLTPPPSPTPVQLTLRVGDKPVNCRYGPGVVYAFVNELQEGQSARAIGRNELSTWWYIRDPGNPAGKCWVAANVTQIQGDAEELPVIAAPLITITKTSMRIEPLRIFVACDQFPQTIFFEAEITASGPAQALWRLESSAGYISSENILIFEKAGMEVVNGYYQVPAAGDHWINLHILNPNDVSERVNFPANCAP